MFKNKQCSKYRYIIIQKIKYRVDYIFDNIYSKVDVLIHKIYCLFGIT